MTYSFDCIEQISHIKQLGDTNKILEISMGSGTGLVKLLVTFCNQIKKGNGKHLI